MFSGTRPAEVLIADDESIAREILQLYLEGLGCRVHAARDGNEALAMFRAGADWIGLVILDARMPGPSPTELYNRIHEISPSVPVLFCSGVSPDDPEIRQINDSGFQLLPKPFNRSGLHQAILAVTQEEETQEAVARYYRSTMG